MEPFKIFAEPTEVEFFSIYTESDGTRYIHLRGYTYFVDGGNPDFMTEDNPDGDYWANMEARYLEIPLDEFIREYEALGENGNDYVNELYEQARQYQDDYSPEEILDIINHYYGWGEVVDGEYHRVSEGNPDAFLYYSEVTMDTPDGNYCFIC